MLPEQQQRIMGYFIEEAKDHLNTIEQGLLSLQETIEDSEKANEVFRAAHSVKGGAAMLGLESIQKTAHRMEDYFKVLKESPVRVDRTLETMFLRVSDGLKDLLEQLEGPFGLTQDKAQEIMTDVEPVFEQLGAHLKTLVSKTGSVPATALSNDANMTAITPEAVQARFKRDVAGLLREMLATFKQPDNAETRKKIQDICAQLIAIGEKFQFPAWCDLIETARIASDSRSNEYRTLAPVLIKEIKKAQDLVLSGRASEVAVCDAMQALLPEDILATESDDLDDLDLDYELAEGLSDLNLFSEATTPNEGADIEESSDEPSDFASLFSEQLESVSSDAIGKADIENEDLFDSIVDSPDADASETAVSDAEVANTSTNEAKLEEVPIGRLSLELDFDDIPSELSTLNRNAESEERADESLDALLATVNVTGPDVGTEELNSLADLFDGDLDELDNTLGGHAFIPEEMQLNPDKIDLSVQDNLNDLLTSDSTEDSLPLSQAGDGLEEDLFGGTLTEGEFAMTDSFISALANEDRDALSELDDFSNNSDLDTSVLDEADQPLIEADDFESVDLSGSSAALDMTTDIAALSEDPWTDEGLIEDADVFGQSDSQGGLNLELPNIGGIDVGNIDLEVPDFSDLDLADSGQGLDDIEGLYLDEPGLSSTSLDKCALDETGMGLSSEGILLDVSGEEVPEVIAKEIVRSVAVPVSTHTVSPRELDIEFPTLTGVKLEEAEKDIDSFFIETQTKELVNSLECSNDDFLLDEVCDDALFSDENLSATSPEDSLVSAVATTEVFDAGEQLADDPWGELPTDPTWAGGEEESNNGSLAMSSAVEQASSELDELLEPPDQVSVAVTTEPELAADDLWAELVAPSESALDSGEEFEGIDLESALLGEDDEDASGLGTDESSNGGDFAQERHARGDSAIDSGWLEEAELSKTAVESAVEPNDLGRDLDARTQDVVGDELSDEILADFETAFGISSKDEAVSKGALSEASETVFTDENWTDKSSSDEGDGIDQLPTLTTAVHEPLDESVGWALTASDNDPDNGFNEGFNEGPDDGSALSVDDLDMDSLFDLDSLHDLAEDEALGSLMPDDGAQGQVAQVSETDSFFEAEEFNLGLGSDLDADLDGFLTEDELDALEDEPPQLENDLAALANASAAPDTLFNGISDADDDFDDLDSLLAEDSFEAADEIADSDASTFVSTAAHVSDDGDEDFGDLERLLEEDGAEGVAVAQQRRAPQRVVRRSGGSLREQNMRVSVSHLDTLSNLVGELVVSRNTLERDQERLRQFLENLLFQVQQLNDVGQRMRDLYERSLLESSLMSNRRAHSVGNIGQNDPTSVEDHATGETFDALEMDRFTGFHTLSQEMIELIVRVRESSSDIGYTVESSDQVTRQFRQITTQLQEGLNTARMVAFSQAADRLPRAVRDISLKCGKEARLVVEGQDTLIDKMIVEHLYDPLTHLVNNAITHGIETPEARKAAGKLPEGTITVRAFYQGNQTVIYVADDGGGINTEFVKQKAIEKSLISQAEADSLSDVETYELLFHPGFSTRDQADDFAGRGVGMDVVRTSLAEIRGSVTVDSELGKGTSFTIRLPLTLSISKALSCVSNQARIAFPMDGVEDMLDVPRDRIVKNDQGQDCVRWRDSLLTFQPVTELLKFNRALGRGRVYGGSQDDDVLSIIVLRSANTYIAVQVDQVIGEQEIVIKQLEGPVPKPLGIAGATILGDGRVMPIADVLELIDIATGRMRRDPASLMWAEDAAKAAEEAPTKNDPTVLIVDDSITVRELLSMSFNKVGYRVEQARDGQEAWDKLRSGLPCDLVFCDIEMPRMDGLELLSRMQKDNHLSRIPIAMLTSRGADRHRQMAVDLGASGYFTKPYLEEALLDAAQRMLNGETLAKGRGG